LLTPKFYVENSDLRAIRIENRKLELGGNSTDFDELYENLGKLGTQQSYIYFEQAKPAEYKDAETAVTAIENEKLDTSRYAQFLTNYARNKPTSYTGDATAATAFGTKVTAYYNGCITQLTNALINN